MSVSKTKNQLKLDQWDTSLNERNKDTRESARHFK